MPSYNLDALGSNEFEKLTQSLLKKVIGSGTITFGPGPDGGREATFSGLAPYPSRGHQWQGDWIFQAKYHDTHLLGIDKARKQIVKDLNGELTKITRKYGRKCDNYILATNVPLSAAPDRGTIDQISTSVVAKFQDKIRNIHVWGKDDIDRLLESNADVRTAYAQFITAGDVLAKLLRASDDRLSELETTVQAYISAQFAREQYAQLDQAGDVSEDPVRIQQVFFELNSTLDQHHSRHPLFDEAILRLQDRHMSARMTGPDGYPTVQLLLSDTIDRAVLIGGPGEGKSTIGQYVAQLHRANLLGKLKEVALNPSYTPVTTRLPLRIILRDYAQWISEAQGPEPAASRQASLERYICEQVSEVTSRTLSTEDLHLLVRQNPSLLILDGLDEVNEPRLQKELLDRLAEFVDRCAGVLRANMQVIATTRPTGYSDQFDPNNFVHLRLLKLKPTQIREYVRRLSMARDLDAAKASRLRQDINECLSDSQIKPLMNTPLQVTILVVIILNGGTPPKQREALFNEYLEVIYKRETAKGKNVISSQRELLVGLHKYIGYILQEKATDGTTAGSYLSRDQYEESLNRYLAHHNPYDSSGSRDRHTIAISRDAGERLVLIVEQHPDSFGFELRSIQEFFAACHLSDTAVNTDERYARFREIAGLSHWRNVALFFAGRVGRNFSGESANIVDVCREFDRAMPDRLIKRGAWLALELAADRAFGSNGRHQHALIDVGLTLLETHLTRAKQTHLVDLLGRLPEDDVTQHLLPLVADRVELWSADRLDLVLSVVGAAAAGRALFRKVVQKMMNVPACRMSVLGVLFRPEIAVPAPVLVEVSSSIESLTDRELARAIATAGRGRRLVESFNRLHVARIAPDRLLSIAVALVQMGMVAWAHVVHENQGMSKFVQSEWDDRADVTVIRAAYLVSAVDVYGPRNLGKTSGFLDEFFGMCGPFIPSAVVEGEIVEQVNVYGPHPVGVKHNLAAILWLVHMSLGNVNVARLSGTPRGTRDSVGRHSKPS